MTVRTPIGHLRTTKANALERGRAHSSAVECLLCKEDALGSNPSGSMSGLIETASLKWDAHLRSDPNEPMHRPVQAWVGRVDTRTVSQRACG